MQTKTTFLALFASALCTLEMSGQGILAPTAISESNAFHEDGKPEQYCTRGDLYINFSASAIGSSDRRVWRSDGTLASTRSISSVVIGTSGDLVGVPGMLYFTQSVRPPQLYASNGAPNSGQLIPQSELLVPQIIVGSPLANNYVFSHGDKRLYSTNGAAGLVRLLSFERIGRSFCAWNGKVFFNAALPNQGSELWVTDGTPAGTVLFKDILPGATGSDPQNLQVIGNKLYFTALSIAGGKRELWVSSGISVNTMKIMEVGNVTSKFEPLVANSVVFPTKFYFVVAGANGNDAVWESNGTPEGTKKVPFHGLVTSGTIQLLPISDGWVRFFARNMAGKGYLHKATFYVNSAMSPIAPIEATLPAGTFGNSVGLCNGTLYYTTSGTASGSAKLWALRAVGPVEVRPTNTQTSWVVSTSADQFFVHRNWLYFSADAGGGGYELYKVQ